MVEPNDCRAAIIAFERMRIVAVALADTTISSYSLVRTYQREVECQRKMLFIAAHAHQPPLLVRGLKNSSSMSISSTCCALKGWIPCPNTLQSVSMT